MKTGKLKPFLKKNNIYLLSFGIPFLIMMLIYIIRQIFPFGDRSFLHVDMYHQYFPFLTEFYHKLKEGESLLYSWNTGIGSNFLALYVYYLASPFNWLAVLVPEAYLIEFMSYLVILKIALCGLSFSFYLRKHFRCSHFAIIFFAVFYALSGYMAAYNWNIMWLDCIALAPIVILGLERLVHEGKCRLYCIALALSILCNYYISIMICIFLVLYFLVLLLSAPNRLKACLHFALYSLLAGGMAAILLIPELAMLTLTEFTNSNFPTTFTAYFSTLDVLARHAMNVSIEIGLAHWPNIYCGVAVIFFLPLYVLGKKTPSKEKFAKLFLLAFLLVSFSYNIPDFIWHGFNYPDSLPARQSFLYIFLLLTLCFEAFLQLKDYSKTQLANVFFGSAVFLILCEKVVTHEDFTTGTFLLTALILMFYGIFIYCYRHHLLPTVWIAGLTLLLVVAEAGINTALTSVPTVSRTSYLAGHDAYEALNERCLARDPGFYRTERFKRLTQNDAMLVGTHSASLFSSTSNALVKEFYEHYGMKSSRVFYSFEGATPFTSALLSTKYMFSSVERKEDSLYRLVDSENGIYLYENTYSLPFGFMVGTDALHAKSELFGSAEDVQSVLEDDAHKNPHEQSLNPIERQNLLAVRLGMETPIFEEIPVTENGTDSILFVPQNGHIYAYADNTKVKEVKLAGDGDDKNYTKLKNPYILDLGQFAFDAKLTLSASEPISLSLSAYMLNEFALQELIDTLSQQTMTVESYSSTHINGHIFAAKDGNLLLSIPYEPGFRVKVDGLETEIHLFEDTMISVPLTAGEHNIEISFYPDSLSLGLLISVVCLALFIFLQIRNRYRQ